MQRNPQYEAGFIRAVDHGDPEYLEMEQKRQARVRKIVVIAAVVVAVGTAVAFAVSRTGDTPEKQLAAAKQLSAANDHRAAIVQYKLSLLGSPDQPAVRFLLGQEYVLLGDAKAAEIEFRKAYDSKYDPERTLPLLVATLLKQERFDKVVTMVHFASLESKTANADLQAMLGSAYFALGKDAEAHAAWKAATDFVPSHPGALLAEANALASNGALDQASDLLAQIPSTAPRQNEVLATRGDIAVAGGRTAEAIESYEAAARIDPGNLPLLLKLAQACVDAGRFDDAKRRVDAILASSRDQPTARFIAAQAAFGKKDYRAASEAIVPSIQQAPRDGKAQMLAGLIALELARTDEAELHLREAVALLPKSIDTRRALADFYVRKHDATKAEETIAPIFASAPGDPRVAEIAARIALLQGDAVKASKAYDQVDATRPDRTEATLKAAALKFAAGDDAGALARLRTASGANPDDVDLDAALIAGYLQVRQPRDAVVAWNALVARRPQDARIYDIRATIDLAAGDRAAARRSMEKAFELDPGDLTAAGGLAKLDLDDHRVDDARERLRRYVAAHPGRSDATLQLVQVERGNGGDDDTVLALLSAARKAAPRAPEVIRALATYYVEHGEAQRALVTADEGLAIAPGDPALLEVVGRAALATGSATRATATYKSLTAMNVESADYPAALGTAWLSAGDPEAALAAFRLSLTRQPDRVDLHRSMTGALLAAGKADEAARLLFEINRLSPKSAALPELDADIKLALKQYPEAIAAYRRVLETTPGSQQVIRTVDALTKARQPGEANAVLSGWLRTHPTDEAVRTFDAEVALRSRDYARASEDFRVLLKAKPNDAALLARLAAADARTDEAHPTIAAERSTSAPPAIRPASMNAR